MRIVALLRIMEMCAREKAGPESSNLARATAPSAIVSPSIIVMTSPAKSGGGICAGANI
jgi:hypothetical protein